MTVQVLKFNSPCFFFSQNPVHTKKKLTLWNEQRTEGKNPELNRLMYWIKSSCLPIAFCCWVVPFVSSGGETPIWKTLLVFLCFGGGTFQMRIHFFFRSPSTRQWRPISIQSLQTHYVSAVGCSASVLIWRRAIRYKIWEKKAATMMGNFDRNEKHRRFDDNNPENRRKPWRRWWGWWRPRRNAAARMFKWWENLRRSKCGGCWPRLRISGFVLFGWKWKSGVG